MFDLDTGEPLEANCSAEGCVILGQATRVALGVAPIEATAYTQRVSDGPADVGLPFLSRSAHGGRMIQQLRW